VKLRKTLAALPAPPTPHNLTVCGQHPGGRQVAGVLDPDKLLEEVASDDRRRLGQFRHGVFEPLEESVQHNTP